jgi:hypothetical protein
LLPNVRTYKTPVLLPARRRSRPIVVSSIGSLASRRNEPADPTPLGGQSYSRVPYRSEVRSEDDARREGEDGRAEVRPREGGREDEEGERVGEVRSRLVLPRDGREAEAEDDREDDDDERADPRADRSRREGREGPEERR